MSTFGIDTWHYYFGANAEALRMVQRQREAEYEAMRQAVEAQERERRALLDARLDSLTREIQPQPQPAHPVVQAVPEEPWWEKLDHKERVSRETALDIEAKGMTWDEYWTNRAG